MRAVSFDIGKCNFAFHIQEFDEEALSAIENIPLKDRYKENGTPTPKMADILEQVYLNGRTILLKNLNLTQGCNAKKKLDPLTFHNMQEVLEEYSEYFDTCSLVLIEQQMAYAGKLNLMALKLAQHCYSFFVFKYGKSKRIIDFPAYHKTEVLGAPKVEGVPYKSGKKRYKAMPKDGKNGRKKWSEGMCREILTLRGESKALEGFEKLKKKDDMADTCIQLEAAKYLLYVEGRQEVE